jgi:hypothetical protein
LPRSGCIFVVNEICDFPVFIIFCAKSTKYIRIGERGMSIFFTNIKLLRSEIQKYNLKFIFANYFYPNCYSLPRSGYIFVANVICDSQISIIFCAFSTKYIRIGEGGMSILLQILSRYAAKKDIGLYF